MGRRDPSRRERDDFEFPVEMNEVLVVQGEFTKKETGKKEAKPLVFWDSSELHDFAKKITYRREDLKIKKVPLFDKEVLESAFLYYAHNGGRSVVRDHLRIFVKELKQKIAAGADCNKDKVCSKYRASLIEGRSLSFSDLREEFEEYAENAKLTNQEELVDFTQSIDKNMQFLHNAVQELPRRDQKKGHGFFRNEGFRNRGSVCQ